MQNKPAYKRGGDTDDPDRKEFDEHGIFGIAACT